MNSEALAYLAAKGLSLDEIVELARIMERKKDTTNAERQARYRERRKQGKVTRYSNGVTPPIESNHTPQSDISPNGESQSQRDVEAVRECWNEVAKANGLATCSKMTGKRLSACKARLRGDGLEAIRQAINHIPKSQFLLGHAGNWQGATIDFLLKPNSVTRILEGQYDDRASKQSTGNRQPLIDIARNVAADLERQAAARAGY